MKQDIQGITGRLVNQNGWLVTCFADFFRCSRDSTGIHIIPIEKNSNGSIKYRHIKTNTLIDSLWQKYYQVIR